MEVGGWGRGRLVGGGDFLIKVNGLRMKILKGVKEKLLKFS